MKNFKKMVLLFMLLALVKTFLSYFVKSPMMFADDYFYMKTAKSFFDSFQIIKFGTDIFPPLYSIIISVSYVFNDMRVVFLLMKFINALVSSLIIIPAWLLAREFLPRKKAFWCVLLVSLLPISFSFSPYIMSENLFAPLFLFSIYFIYKAFTRNKITYDFLAGLFIGLSYLTRVIGISLAGTALLLTAVFLIKKQFKIARNKIILFLTGFIAVLPWLIKTYSNYKDVSGYASLSSISERFSAVSSLMWGAKGLSYLFIASLLIFGVAALIWIIKSENNSKNLTLKLCLVFTVFIQLMIYCVYRSSLNRLIGRYLEHILPLIIIAGFISINYYYLKNTNWKELFLHAGLISALFLISIKILDKALFPVNNIGLSFIGALGIMLGFATKYNLIILSVLVILSPALIFAFKKMDSRKIFLISLCSLILLNALCYGIAIFNYDYNWKNLDQTQLGFWINDEKIQTSKFLIDKRDVDEWNNLSLNQGLFDKKTRSIETLGYWIRGEITEGDAEKPRGADYIISTYKLNFLVIAKGNYNDKALYIYEAKQ